MVARFCALKLVDGPRSRLLTYPLGVFRGFLRNWKYRLGSLRKTPHGGHPIHRLRFPVRQSALNPTTTLTTAPPLPENLHFYGLKKKKTIYLMIDIFLYIFFFVVCFVFVSGREEGEIYRLYRAYKCGTCSKKQVRCYSNYTIFFKY